MSRQSAPAKPVNRKGKGEEARGFLPHANLRLDTVAAIRAEMARIYKLGLSGKMKSDEMTRFIYALREIRGAAEAELLTDVQARLAALSAIIGARANG